MSAEHLTGAGASSHSPFFSGYPKRRPDLTVRIVDGETVVLDRQKGLIHQLNRTASYIWDQCDGTSTLEAIVARFSEAFAVDRKTATADVTATVLQLQQLQLLES